MKFFNHLERYNDVVNGMPNKLLTYNGVELEESLDLNMYEMDLRQYDPAIARWIVQDPIVHFDYSPYQAFDNNPVFWADPSSTNSEKKPGFSLFRAIFGRIQKQKPLTL